MAYTYSGWYINNVLAPFVGTAFTGGTGGINMTSTNGQYMSISLLTYSSVTDGSSPVNFYVAAASSAWVNTFEATGTGWSSGGVALNVAASGSTQCTPTFAATGSTRGATLEYTWTNPLAVSGTTLTGVGGCIIYFNSVTSPATHPMMLSICFGAGYSTSSGVFGITPSGSGLSTINLTP